MDPARHCAGESKICRGRLSAAVVRCVTRARGGKLARCALPSSIRFSLAFGSRGVILGSVNLQARNCAKVCPQCAIHANLSLSIDKFTKHLKNPVGMPTGDRDHEVGVGQGAVEEGRRTDSSGRPTPPPGIRDSEQHPKHLGSDFVDNCIEPEKDYFHLGGN